MCLLVPEGDQRRRRARAADEGDALARALVLILNVSYIELLILVFPVWVAAVSVVILRGARSRPGTEPQAAQ